MTIRSILAVTTPALEAEAGPIAPIALDLAARWKARLAIALLVPDKAEPVYGGAPVGALVVMQEDAAGLEQARLLGETFARTAGEAGVAASIEVIKGDYASAMSRLAGHARLADLTLVRRTEAMSQATLEVLLFDSGRPCLLCDKGATAPIALDRILIAWDGKLPSARAAMEAMPLLEGGKHVEIVSVVGDGPLNPDSTPEDLRSALAAHGVSAKVSNLADTGDAGAQILEHARMTGADVLVMGAYAHSRLRQFFFGGVTTTMLERADMPVLMAH
jgi:nucleotide-binding universal stress UspA family protein